MAVQNLKTADANLSTEAVSQRVLVWEAFKRHKLAMISAVVFLILTVACFAAPVIAPFDFDAINLGRDPPAAYGGTPDGYG